MDIVTVDIGGTHARFALARLDGGCASLGAETVLRTSDHDGLESAWRAYAAIAGPLPPAAAIAIAGPVDGRAVTMTNNRWVVRPASLRDDLKIEKVTLVNDFAAVAHAISACSEHALRHICGPEAALPGDGVITIVGPGTGLGVAMLDRNGVQDRVIATEGGHIAFAPLDDIEARLHERLRARFDRVSVERILCGAGLAAIVDRDGVDDKALWASALAGTDAKAAEGLALFCRVLGSVAGDLALAQGAAGVVIAGGLGLRLAAHLPGSGFAERFTAKGRFRDRLAAMPVKLITHPQPGLLGAAAAFAAEHIRP